jgi:hypothetical protein
MILTKNKEKFPTGVKEAWNEIFSALYVIGSNISPREHELRGYQVGT